MIQHLFLNLNVGNRISNKKNVNILDNSEDINNK